jgi:hypothetical protein
MAKILFIDGSILTTDKAFAPKDEQNIVIFTNATHAESGNIANLVLNIFGNKPGANKLATHNIVAFGDNINFGQPAPMLKAEPKAEAKPVFPPSYVPAPTSSEDEEDGLPF